MAVQRNSLCVALLGVLTVSVLLSGCGGGGGGDGGGGGGGGASFLTLTSNMLYGNSGPGGTTTTPYPTDPPAGVPVPAGSPSTNYQVAQPVFAAGALGTQTFLELNFNRTVRASSIISNPPSGSDGIVLFVTANGSDFTPPCLISVGSPVCMKLDVNGVLNPANLVVGDTAPATVRLYYDPDDNLLTPDALPTGTDYSLVITNNLRTADGGPFCVGNGSSNCVNSYLPAMPFSIGPNATALAMATTPIVPVSGEASAPINTEVTVNFTDSVDFLSVAGGVAQVTTMDPFISIPFTLDGMPPQPNIQVAYTPPTDPVTLVQQTLPPSLGFIIYMPDPKLNPTQVRLRFVDLTNLQPVNNPPTSYQNYASNPQKFPIPSSDPMQGGATLQLPAIKNVPGSLLASNSQVAPANVQITVTTMVTDRANTPPGPGNALAGQFIANYTYSIGPTVARNPVGPDAIIIGSPQGGPTPFDKPGITVCNTANTTGSNTAVPCTNIPAWTGVPVTGVLTLLPPTDRISNLAVLGVPGDLENGPFLNPNGVITDAPRGTTVPGVLDDQNGTAPSGILNCINPMIPPPQPPYGLRLYVTDLTSGSLKVFNSYDFSLITTIPGIASPRGLGISPDLNFLYVSNEQQATVQRINSNPASPNFHTITNTIVVGIGPRSISVQPANEDAIVANFVENTVSFIRTSTQTERARFSTGLGPTDIFVTRRMLGMGLTNEYMAFIPCLFGNSVNVYESSGGAVLENLPNGRMVATEGGFLGPTRGTWNWQSYINLFTGPGCFVANTIGSNVDILFLNFFTLSPPPGFPGPAGTRTFIKSTVASQFPGPADISIDNMSGMYNFNVVGFTNNKAACDPSLGAGIPSVIVVAYPSIGMCVAYDYNSPAFFAEVSVPGCDFTQAYFDQ